MVGCSEGGKSFLRLPNHFFLNQACILCFTEVVLAGRTEQCLELLQNIGNIQLFVKLNYIYILLIHDNGRCVYCTLYSLL